MVKYKSKNVLEIAKAYGDLCAMEREFLKTYDTSLKAFVAQSILRRMPGYISDIPKELRERLPLDSGSINNLEKACREAMIEGKDALETNRTSI